MKKKVLTILLVLIFTLAVPFSAMAGNMSKGMFIDNMNKMQAKQIQIQPSFDRPLCGEITASVSGEPINTLGFKNAKANIKYEMDMKNDKAFFQIDAGIEGSAPKNIKMDFYVADDNLIIPVESLKNMAQINPSMEMPPDNVKYVYTKMDGFSFNEVLTIVNQQQDAGMQAAAMDLVKTLFEAVPDSCFTSNGSAAVMNLDKTTIINYAHNFKDPKFVDKLSEQITALNLDSSDKASDNDQITKDLQASEDVSFVTALKNLDIRKCRTEVGSSTSAIDWDFGYSDEKMNLDCRLISKSDIQNDKASSTTDLDLRLKSPARDNDIAVKLYADSTANAKESSGSMNIKVTGNAEGTKVDLAADLNIDQEFKDAVSFAVPVLTEENSIDSEALEPETDDSDIENQINVNINDYDDYIWFDNAPFIENGRILVPARELVEYLDGKVAWNPPTTVVISAAGKEITMNIGDKSCTVNGQNREMDSVPVIREGVTYVPIRFLAEALGYEVSYDEEAMEVCLNSKSSPK